MCKGFEERAVVSAAPWHAREVAAASGADGTIGAHALHLETALERPRRVGLVKLLAEDRGCEGALVAIEPFSEHTGDESCRMVHVG